MLARTVHLRTSAGTTLDGDMSLRCLHSSEVGAGAGHAQAMTMGSIRFCGNSHMYISHRHDEGVVAHLIHSCIITITSTVTNIVALKAVKRFIAHLPLNVALLKPDEAAIVHLLSRMT